MAASFHSRTGSLVKLSNSNRSACREHPTQEFNNGVVLSSEPLPDNQIFEVKIDRKVNSWSGSIEIGVTTCEPANLEFPVSATGFREGTWVMSGSSVLKDGHAMIEEYGSDLDQLSEGDRVGVMRTSEGVLHFFINGTDQGQAATDVPPSVYAVVDMYGKCAQVTIADHSTQDNSLITNELANQLATEFFVELTNQITNDLNISRENEDSIACSNDRLVFHEHCGSLIKLSNNRRTAERRRPLDEFNNGVVMTNRPVKEGEVFEIRLDRLVDKWSGSIEVGITSHNPSLLEFPPTMNNMRRHQADGVCAAENSSENSNTMDFPTTMSNMRTGTIMMSGCGILTNGKGTRREYGQYNLDELTEGDRIGILKKASGALHFFINGIDQGVAANNTPDTFWGVIDLYGMAVKVTILDRNDPDYPSNVPPPPERRANSIFRQFPDMYVEDTLEEEDEPEKLLFHPKCGSHASVINGGRVAHRPNALDDFNNGVVLTNRPLRPNEMFEVRIDKMVDKWAGSIEIGVTLYSSDDLDFPSTMTNIRCGTWMMTGNGVMYNGTTIIDDYGQNLDKLKQGDRVGVLRKENGTLHFFVNGIDQGPAAMNVAETVYGVIDLYGQAAEATIMDPSELLSSPEIESSILTDSDELRFHSLHGLNANVVNSGKTAVRPNAAAEFNDAIVMSHRPLKDNELFEVIIEKMVDRWSGSIEAGVSLIKPEELPFPNTMTDIDYDTWMLSGSAIMQDGSTTKNGYPLDLDSIVVNCRIGMMRRSDGTLHYYKDGVDMGVACTDIPQGVYAVIDLYGQCGQVSITSGSGVVNSNMLSGTLEHSTSSPLNSEVTHRFSQCCGRNIQLKNNGCIASRVHGYSHGVVFSSDPIKRDELFEIKIENVNRTWSGSLQIGLTTLAISDTSPLSVVPQTATELTSKVTWLITGSEVRKNGIVIKENYMPSLDRLEIGNRIGIKRSSDATMHVLVNGEDLGVAATNIPKNVFAVIDIFGMIVSISVTSSASTDMLNSLISPSLPSELEERKQNERDEDRDTVECTCFEFSGNHGKNILLSNNNMTAERTASYNQGIVVLPNVLPRNKLLQVRIDRLNSRWSASLMLGVLGFSPERFNFPISALSLKKLCVLIHGNGVYYCGTKVKEKYGSNIDNLKCGDLVGILVDDDSCLHMYINGVDQGIASKEIPALCYAFIDIYGQCEQVTIVTDENFSPAYAVSEDKEKADLVDVVKEKHGRSNLIIESSLSRNCEYQNICSRVRSSLGLPESYFDSQFTVCYCETCHKIRGEDSYHKKGEPPKEYAVPCGWCRFNLRLPTKTHSPSMFDRWHRAYCGTKIENVRRILDSGDIHIPVNTDGRSGSILQPQPASFTEKSHPDDCDIEQVFLSPTIRYAGSNDFAPKHKFTDPKTKKLYFVRVAFQVWIKPGSYKVGPLQSTSVYEQIDPRFTNSELEWSTKERGSVKLYSLLIKLE